MTPHIPMLAAKLTGWSGRSQCGRKPAFSCCLDGLSQWLRWQRWNTNHHMSRLQHLFITQGPPLNRPEPAPAPPTPSRGDYNPVWVREGGQPGHGAPLLAPGERELHTSPATSGHQTDGLLEDSRNHRRRITVCFRTLRSLCSRCFQPAKKIDTKKIP